MDELSMLTMATGIMPSDDLPFNSPPFYQNV